MTAHQREELRVQSKDYTFKMYDAFGSYLYKYKYRYMGRHMAVSPFKHFLLFRKPKNAEISKRSG